MANLILYNAIMAVVDIAAIAAIGRFRTTRAWLAACAGGGVAACAVVVPLAAMSDDKRFSAFALVACGLFLHGVIVLGASALLLRRARRKTALFSAVLAVLVVLVAVDAFLIEPRWLDVSHVRIVSPKVARAVRIVVIADLQTDGFGDYERKVFRRVLEERPDVILFAGDYLQADPSVRSWLAGEISAFLEELEFSAPGGVFAVKGNVDRSDWKALFDGLPVTATDTTQSFELADLRLTCLSALDSFISSAAVPAAPAGRFHVVLGHSPRYALGKVEADLLIAGHTHGGQVCLPLIGPLVVPYGHSRRWAAGLIDLSGGRKLYISRGVGMERDPAPRLRFFCRPELVVIDVVPR